MALWFDLNLIALGKQIFHVQIFAVLLDNLMLFFAFTELVFRDERVFAGLNVLVLIFQFVNALLFGPWVNKGIFACGYFNARVMVKEFYRIIILWLIVVSNV